MYIHIIRDNAVARKVASGVKKNNTCVFLFYLSKKANPCNGFAESNGNMDVMRKLHVFIRQDVEAEFGNHIHQAGIRRLCGIDLDINIL